MIAHLVYIPFVFALGACIGSFLNVVVWRLPRGESLVSPPSHCPKCSTRLAWFDNIPIFGWILLHGRCRYCKQPISPRYPIIETITALLFVLYYWAFFMQGIWQVPLRPDLVMMMRRPMVTVDATFIGQWPMYMLYMFVVAGLLAASLIDAEQFIIPLEIPWLMALAGLVFHPLADQPFMPGSLDGVSPVAAALALGAGVGLMITLALFYFGIIPQSFPDGEPLLEVERADYLEQVEKLKKSGTPAAELPLVPPPYTRGQIRIEIRKEMLFLMLPMLLAVAAVWLTKTGAPMEHAWQAAMKHLWLRSLLGSLLGALVGAVVVWLFRIFGTIAFGRVAMGMGDVHLMFGVGAVLGAGTATIAFFLAPFFGIVTALYMFFSGKRRELPYGPYLSLGTAATMFFYQPIVAWLQPGLQAMWWYLCTLLGA